MDHTVGRLFIKLCCSSRCRLTLFSSISLFLLLLMTTATNYLSLPWTEISSTAMTPLATSPNASVYATRVEFRSLSGNPTVFSCLETRFNVTPPQPALLQQCSKNASALPLDSQLLAGFNEYAVKRQTLALVLVALGGAVCGIALILCFQFHACRLDDGGRPFPGSRLCLRSPRQVLAVLLAAIVFCALSGGIVHYASSFYVAEVTLQWYSALPRPDYRVVSGAGVLAMNRISTYAWGALAVLLISSCFGPLGWPLRGEPFELPPDRGQQQQHLRPASPRHDFALRELVHLPVEALPSRGGSGSKNEFGWRLEKATYAPTAAAPPSAPPGSPLAFTFATPLRRQ